MSVLCEGVKMDIEVIDKVNANSQYMKKEEIKKRELERQLLNYQKTLKKKADEFRK